MGGVPMIGLLVRSLQRGGAERQVVELAKQLHTQGSTPVCVIVFYSGGAFESELQESGVRVIPLGKSGRWDVLGFGRRLAQVVHAEKISTLYSFTPVPNVFAALLRLVNPQLRVVWGVRAGYMDLAQYDFISRIFYDIEGYLSFAPQVIICNSQAGQKLLLQKKYPPQKLQVISNGFDTKYFAPNAALRQLTRQGWLLPDELKVIGLVGRLDPMKDHTGFVQAAAQVVAQYPTARFVCVGGGSEVYLKKLRALAKELGLENSLWWVAEAANMPAIYNGLDILCSASYGEGFSNVIGEAMACGVPCVVTNVGDSAYIVGETGIVVPPQNVAALAQGLLQMLRKDLPPKGVQARQRIEQNFSLALLREKTLAVL